MTPIVKLIALIVAMMAIVAVGAEARPHANHPALKEDLLKATSSPLMNAPDDNKLWAAITKKLEARNYSRPDLGANAYGVDISQWMGQSTWSCLKQNGFSFGIVRAGCSNGAVDGNGVHSVANAWAAGIEHVDIYLFPCFPCGISPENQVAQTIRNMGSVPFGMIWMDVEAAGSGWSGNVAANHDFLVRAINQAAAMIGSNRIGIYSSAYGWSVAMGGFSDLAHFPMCYDNNPSFSDWKSFGGWARPAIKQYAGDVSVCGFNVDKNCW